MRFKGCKSLVVLLAFLAGGLAAPATAAAKCRQRAKLGNLDVCVRKCKGGKLEASISGGQPNATIPVTINCLEMELPTSQGGYTKLELKHLVKKNLTLKVIDLSGPLPREYVMEIRCKGRRR